MALIRPILEYGQQIYASAAVSNLDKLERVQLREARIITGLRHSCPNDIVLYEANLQPLGLRRQVALTRYYGKLFGYGSQHRTAIFLLDWRDNQRLKRDSPVGYAHKMGILFPSVEHHNLLTSLAPTENLPNVKFHDQLLVSTNKGNQVPELLKQLALEVINNTPGDAIQIFTDGSKNERGNTGSGILIRLQDNLVRISKRNPDFCSVFRSELIAIDEALKYLVDHDLNEKVWIFSDSRSAIQHLRNWRGVGDRTSVDIIDKLKKLSVQNEIHIQWIPSHVDLYFNDVADGLAKAGTMSPGISSGALTFQELSSKRKFMINNNWRIAPPHDWYRGIHPGAALEYKGARNEQTSLARFNSGHIRSLSYDRGCKTFALCTKCEHAPASPEHILLCLGLSREDLQSSPALVMDFLRVNDLMDLI